MKHTVKLLLCFFGFHKWVSEIIHGRLTIEYPHTYCEHCGAVVKPFGKDWFIEYKDGTGKIVRHPPVGEIKITKEIK